MSPSSLYESDVPLKSSGLTPALALHSSQCFECSQAPRLSLHWLSVELQERSSGSGNTQPTHICLGIRASVEEALPDEAIVSLKHSTNRPELQKEGLYEKSPSSKITDNFTLICLV